MGKTETVQGKRNERNIYLKDKEDERLQSYEGEDKKAELNHDKNSLSIYELELKKKQTAGIYMKPILRGQKRWDAQTELTMKSRTQSSQESKDYSNKIYVSLVAEVEIGGDCACLPASHPADSNT